MHIVDNMVYELLEKLSLQVGDMGKQIVTMNSEIANMNNKMSDMSNKILNMNNKMSDMNNRIDGIEERMATKEDLKNLATKEDLNMVAEELHTEIQSVYEEVVELRRDSSTMEMLTTKNAFDIAKIKAIR